MTKTTFKTLPGTLEVIQDSDGAVLELIERDPDGAEVRRWKAGYAPRIPPRGEEADPTSGDGVH